MTIIQPAIQQIRRGNPKAIEALLHRQLRSKGLRVQVLRQEKQLCIYFTGKAAPRRQELLPLVDRALRHVEARAITVARVQAYRNGMREAVWSNQIFLRRSLRRSGLQRWLATGRGKAIAGGAGLLMLFCLISLLRGPSESQLASGSDPATSTDETSTAISGRTQASDAANTSGTARETMRETGLSGVPNDGLVRIDGLPAHRLREQDVFDSKRVQLDAKDDISRDECRALAAHYLDAAGANGKVVVQKPNPKSPWNGKRAPYCANNLDGQGTFFNDEYF